MEASLIAKMPPTIKGQAFENWCYLGNPQTPNIGDQRVQFQTIRPGAVSLIARQTGATFEPYKAASGKDVELIEPGTHSPDNMFNEAQQENKLIAWALRLGGIFLMIIAIALILKPISVFLDVIPLLGDIAGFGTGLVSFVAALSLSFLIIAVAWFSYRPLLSVGLIASGIALIFLMKMRKRRRIA